MTPEQKDALCEQGSSQTLAFLSKRALQEVEKRDRGTLPLVVEEGGTGL
jgi:hypothetical protein